MAALVSGGTRVQAWRGQSEPRPAGAERDQGADARQPEPTPSAGVMQGWQPQGAQSAWPGSGPSKHSGRAQLAKVAGIKELPGEAEGQSYVFHSNMASKPRPCFTKAVRVNLLGPGHEAAMARVARRERVVVKPAGPS